MSNKLTLTLTIVLALFILGFAEPQVGGWNQFDKSKLTQLKMDISFAKANNVCIEQYLKMNQGKNQSNLGTITDVSTQIVAGINYKIIYTNPQGEKTECTIFVQSWTDTYEVIDLGKVQNDVKLQGQGQSLGGF